MAEPDPGPDDASRIGHLQLQEARVVNFGTSDSFVPFTHGPEDNLQQYLADVEPVEDEQDALDCLQRTQTTTPDSPALLLVLKAFMSSLPQKIQNLVGLYTGEAEEKGEEDDDDDSRSVYPGTIQAFCIAKDDESFEELANILKDTRFPSLGLEDKEFVFWVVDAGTFENPHYVTIVLHKETRDLSRPNQLDRVTHWALVDTTVTDDEPEATKQVRHRMQRLLHDQGIPDDAEQTIWVPKPEPGDELLSGLGVYAVISQLLDRIGTMYHHHAGFDAETFFAPTRPWFNPDAVRAEMLGCAAFKAMDKLKWKARLGLYPIKLCTNDNDGRVVDALGSAATANSVQDSDSSDADSSSFGPPGGGSECDGKGGREDLPGASDAAGEHNDNILTPETSSDEEDENERQDQLARESLNNAARGADEATREAAEFARRVEYEVLGAPLDTVPTACTVERLERLLQRATEQCRHVIFLIQSFLEIDTMAGRESSLDKTFLKHLEDNDARGLELEEACGVLEECKEARGEGDGENDEQLDEVVNGMAGLDMDESDLRHVGDDLIVRSPSTSFPTESDHDMVSEEGQGRKRGSARYNKY
ncbi:hypothetical protein GGR50DRAFT_690647 [Xylaria sp. CBS 124048]|nr:hypothetical protein GGR50DRAFT_690647 [Xylaria sp. CBS 124048]